MEERVVKVSVDRIKIPYRGDDVMAILDFNPDDAGIWGCAPAEDGALAAFKALVDRSACIDGDQPYGLNIISCEPDPESHPIHRFKINKDDPKKPPISQASRWIVKAHRDYSD